MFYTLGVRSSVELVSVLLIISSKSLFLLPLDPKVSSAVTKSFGVARPWLAFVAFDFVIRTMRVNKARIPGIQAQIMPT